MMGMSEYLDGTTPYEPATKVDHAVLSYLIWQSLSPSMQIEVIRGGSWYPGKPVTDMTDVLFRLYGSRMFSE